MVNLLARPDEQRRREYKYRFSQSVIFGLPVVALQLYGTRLGPADADRWVSLLQALLAGWIVYVNLGMLAEGALLIARGLGADLLITAAALALYGYSLISAAIGIVTGRLWYRPLMFWACAVLLAAWTGLRWWQWARRIRATG